MALTKRQKQVLDVLQRFINAHGYSPSFEEIAKSLKLSSLATVHKHIATLEKKGFIRRGYNQSRSIDVVALPGPVPFAWASTVAAVAVSSPRSRAGVAAGNLGRRDAGALGNLEFPLLGRIAAGRPVEAIANAETLSLGDFARRKSGVFVLKVKGDSMVGDHICDGDYILVEGSSEARNGDIVVALVEGTDATLKRLFHEKDGRVRLQPANSQMDPILLPAHDVQIQGKVIGVLRKY
jgi:repressor LexA